MKQGLTAVVAAFNEGPRIASVLRVLCEYGFEEVIVVDDGSQDDTYEVASSFPVVVIRLPKNLGKGSALQHGIEVAKTENIFFCDADVVGLRHEHISAICVPVLIGKTEMCVGMRDRTLFMLPLVLKSVPHLGGERCLTKTLWKRVQPGLKQGFMIEIGLNTAAKRMGGYQVVLCKGLTQTVKERKFGLVEGLKRRLFMVFQVMAAIVKSRL